MKVIDTSATSRENHLNQTFKQKTLHTGDHKSVSESICCWGCDN